MTQTTAMVGDRMERSPCRPTGSATRSRTSSSWSTRLRRSAEAPDVAGVLTGVEQWFYEQWVYELLIEGLSRSVDELRALAGDRQDDIGAAVSALEARTLLLRRPGEPPRYDVRHPQEGVAALLAARQEQLRHVAALVLHHRAEK